MRVPSDQIEQVEDAHVVVARSVCVALRARLKAESVVVASDALPSGVDRVIDMYASGSGS